MKRLLYWLRVCLGGVHLRRAAAPDRLPVAPLAPEWTRENATQLRQFLSSPTGLTLLAKARAADYFYCRQTAQAASVGEVSVSTFSDAINWLESLTRVAGDQATTDDAPSGEREGVEPEFAKQL